MKTLTPLNDNIIIKGIIEKTLIITDSKESKRIQRLEIFKVGKEVKGLKEGQRVIVNPRILTEVERVIDPFDEKDKFDKEKEFYIIAKEQEIIGYY